MKDSLLKEVNPGDIVLDLDTYCDIGVVTGATKIGRPRIVLPQEMYDGNYNPTGIGVYKKFIRNGYLKMTLQEATEFLQRYDEEEGFEFGENHFLDDYIAKITELIE